MHVWKENSKIEQILQSLEDFMHKKNIKIFYGNEGLRLTFEDKEYDLISLNGHGGLSLLPRELDCERICFNPNQYKEK